MVRILSVSSSPSALSHTRTRGLLHEVGSVDIKEIPAEELPHADFSHPGLAEVIKQFEMADSVVIGTSVYKADFAEVIKSFLDLLMQFARSRHCGHPGGKGTRVLVALVALAVVAALFARTAAEAWGRMIAVGGVDYLVVSSPFDLCRCPTVLEPAGRGSNGGLPCPVRRLIGPGVKGRPGIGGVPLVLFQQVMGNLDDRDSVS